MNIVQGTIHEVRFLHEQQASAWLRSDNSDRLRTSVNLLIKHSGCGTVLRGHHLTVSSLQSLVYNALTWVPVMSCNLLANTIAHLGLRSQGKLQM